MARNSFGTGLTTGITASAVVVLFMVSIWFGFVLLGAAAVTGVVAASLSKKQIGSGL